MLSALASIYAKAANVRNTLYDREIFRSYDLGARTISIGNITAGGTGKTPLVAYVANALAVRGEKVCVLTRGYGRKNPKSRVLVSDGRTVLVGADEGGDEPVELAAKLLGKAIVVADPDRVAAAAWARDRFEITTFVLDDGFQHRRARRDLDIVCIDATDPFGGSKMLPAGRLRESVENLARADAIVITRANQAKNLGDLKSQIADLISKISAADEEPAIFTLTSSISEIVPLATRDVAKKTDAPELSKTAEVPSGKAFAFCGIGNPENFFAGVRDDEIELAGHRSFPDHHRYSPQDLIELENAAVASGASYLLTTAKDAVKLRELSFNRPCYVGEIEIRIDSADRFAAQLMA